MHIRLTKFSEIAILQEIYQYAKKYMRQNGNLEQWNGEYPTNELLLKDIETNCSYVCIKNDEIIATFCFFEDGEPTYDKIFQGKWLNNQPYGVVHRIATKTNQKGIGSFCLDWCYKKCQNLRIDTHFDNIPMRKLLEKNEFEYCGIIYLKDGFPRLAFQKDNLNKL